MPILAPIALFVYARPEHTRKTLEALSGNPEAARSLLYIFADGPPAGASGDFRSRIELVRTIAKEKQWCGQVEVIELPDNLGLAESIVQGVSRVVNLHGRIIVLEDDIVVEKGFLHYMNAALDLYAENHQVAQISGYCYPFQTKPSRTTYFLKAMSCWGWGTWKRAWRHYQSDADQLLQWCRETAEREHAFNLEGSADYVDQLKANVDGRKTTWAVKWFASWMKEGGLCLYPGGSLVQNIGHDATGVNCGASSAYAASPIQSLDVNPIRVIEDKKKRKALASYYRKHVTSYRHRASVRERITRRLVRFSGLRVLRRFAWKVLLKINPNFKLFDREGFRYFYDSFFTDTEASGNTRLMFPCHMEASSVGEFTYIAQGAWIFRTKIGKFCSIGPNLSCGWGTHPLNGISTAPMFYSTKKQNGHSLCGQDKVKEWANIQIGNDVFIGMNVTVLDGVTIGDGAVIGAGAVVSKDIPPYAIAAGNPIRILRYRFDEKTIEKLLQVQWWNWPSARLKEVEEKFFDVDGFLEAALTRGNPEGAADCRS